MDRIESLGSTISNITLYDIKSMYNQVRFILSKATRVSSVRAGGVVLMHLDAKLLQAKNVVFNVSEMEAKVREATNEDPWCVRTPWERGEYAESVGDCLGVRVPR
jgi:epsin